ncbi:unnamed protein product [Candida verbasci]|uniref:FAD-binding FR-type domain-containing protein n=1 Tax=Candida verbasci TaxID=1227364 RepID=A0A9W4U0J5_9ASCO|nr:unnamed protein product [Candida verbasci]
MIKLVSIFLISVLASAVNAGHDGPKSFSSFDISMQACTKYIAKNMEVCPSAGKHSYSYDCYCHLDTGFGTISDCFVTGYENHTDIIEEFTKQCNFTLTEFYNKYDKIQQEFKKNHTHYYHPNKTAGSEGKSGSDKSGHGGSKSKRAEEGHGGNVAGKAAAGGGHGGTGEEEIKLSPVPLRLDYGDKFTPYKNAYRMYNNNFNISMDYGAILLGYWGCVLVIAMVFNFKNKMFPKLQLCPKFIQKHITIPATFKKYKASQFSFGLGGFFDCLIPTRLETISLVVFVLLTGFLSALHIHHVDNNPQYTTRNAELGHIIADRTGILSCFLIPLIILFGGRNNVLQFVTNWDYATFIMYHRWISRITILLVIVHAITFSVSDKATGKYKNRMQKPFMIWGTVACISGGFVLFQAMLFFRRKCYEVFLLIHIVLVVLFVVGGWYHLYDMGYQNFMWAAIAIWVFDRVVRILRICSFGVRKATISIVGDETLKVIVDKPKYWKSIPGGHAFVHFIKPTIFYQSHPFTFTTHYEDTDKIVFYAKVKNGATARVHKHLINCPGNTSTIRVLIEGPYGNPSGAGRQVKNIVYMAGGNGIPGIYSELVDVASKNVDRSIKLVWVIRHWKSLSWFMEELKELNKFQNVESSIYITKPNDYSGIECLNNNNSVSYSDSEEMEEKKIDEKDSASVHSTQISIISNVKNELSHMEFIEGRPNITSIVNDEIVNTDDSLAFVTCGAPMMVDELRYNVTNSIDKSKYKIEFHEQLQTWA